MTVTGPQIPRYPATYPVAQREGSTGIIDAGVVRSEQQGFAQQYRFTPTAPTRLSMTFRIPRATWGDWLTWVNTYAIGRWCLLPCIDQHQIIDPTPTYDWSVARFTGRMRQTDVGEDYVDVQCQVDVWLQAIGVAKPGAFDEDVDWPGGGGVPGNPPNLPECNPYQCNIFELNITSPLWFPADSSLESIFDYDSGYLLLGLRNPDDHFDVANTTNPPIDPCVAGDADWVLDIATSVDAGSADRLVADEIEGGTDAAGLPGFYGIFFFRRRLNTSNFRSIAYNGASATTWVSQHSRRFIGTYNGGTEVTQEFGADIYVQDDLNNNTVSFYATVVPGLPEGGNEDTVFLGTFDVDGTDMWDEWSMLYVETEIDTPVQEVYEVNPVLDRWRFRCDVKIRLQFFRLIDGETVINEVFHIIPRVAGAYTLSPEGVIGDPNDDNYITLFKGVHMQVAAIETFSDSPFESGANAFPEGLVPYWRAWRMNQAEYTQPDYCLT